MAISLFAYLGGSNSRLSVEQQAAELVGSLQIRMKGFEFKASQHLATGFIGDHDPKGLVGSIK